MARISRIYIEGVLEHRVVQRLTTAGSKLTAKVMEITAQFLGLSLCLTDSLNGVLTYAVLQEALHAVN